MHPLHKASTFGERDSDALKVPILDFDKVPYTIDLELLNLLNGVICEVHLIPQKSVNFGADDDATTIAHATESL